MKLQIRLLAVGLTLILLTGCSTEGNKSEDQILKQVTVLEVAVEEQLATEMYLGTIMPEEIEAYAFKSAGKIDEILVKEGDQIQAGQVLARLDTTDLDFQLEGAKWQMETAKAQYEQIKAGARDEALEILALSKEAAQEAFELTRDQSDKMKELYDKGAISEMDYKQALLSKVEAQTALGQVTQQLAQAQRGATDEALAAAHAQYEVAMVQYKAVESLVEDTELIALKDGVVVDLPYSSGTLIDAGMPVVLTRHHQNYIQLGLTQKDMNRIQTGQEVEVLYEETVFQGAVRYIDAFADSTTGTFLVEIEPLNGGSFDVPYGSICEIYFEMDLKEGIWVPLASILNEGIDYVYLAKDGVALRRRIDRLGIRDNYVLVDGLSAGDRVIVEGIMSINEGDLIQVSGGKNHEQAD